MSPRTPPGDQRLRLRVAQEAARILADEGTRDFHAAKQKAAQRLGISDRGHLPKNSEIEEALIEHQRLFNHEGQRQQLQAIRQTSLGLMDLLEPYSPHVVGAVLRGTADRHSTIELHLFADAPEEVAIYLMERRIPYQAGERRWQLGDQTLAYPAFRFESDGFATELTVFPIDGQRQAPPCSVERRPMRRANRQRLAQLLEAE